MSTLQKVSLARRLADRLSWRAVKPSAFDYHAPSRADEAVALLAELGEGAKVSQIGARDSLPHG
jgi:hypothetical protein